jgi:hypothetical protein
MNINFFWYFLYTQRMPSSIILILLFIYFFSSQLNLKLDRSKDSGHRRHLKGKKHTSMQIYLTGKPESRYSELIFVDDTLIILSETSTSATGFNTNK